MVDSNETLAYESGYDSGYALGYEEGYEAALKESIETLNPRNGEVIALKFNANITEFCEVQNCFEYLKNICQNNDIVVLPNSTSLDVFTKDQLQKWIDICELVMSTM